MEYRLRFCPDAPPLAVLAAAAVGGVSLVPTPDKNISEGMPPSLIVSEEWASKKNRVFFCFFLYNLGLNVGRLYLKKIKTFLLKNNLKKQAKK